MFSPRYEEAVHYEPPAYEAYSYPPAPPATSRSRYEIPEYEPAEYRRDYYREPTYAPGKKFFFY